MPRCSRMRSVLVTSWCMDGSLPMGRFHMDLVSKESYARFADTLSIDADPSPTPSQLLREHTGCGIWLRETDAFPLHSNPLLMTFLIGLIKLQNNIASAASNVLEFYTLSHLTGNTTYQVSGPIIKEAAPAMYSTETDQCAMTRNSPKLVCSPSQQMSVLRPHTLRNVMMSQLSFIVCNFQP